MTVKELIDKLSKCDPNAGISITDVDCYDTFKLMDVLEEYGTVYIKANFSIDRGY